MDHTIPLWAVTTAVAALFAVSLAAAHRLRTKSSRCWSGALALLLLRLAAGHLDPHGAFSEAALYFGRLASPAFTLLFCLGALYQANGAPSPYPLLAGGLAAGGWLAILTNAAANPPLAVFPAEGLAALLCLYTLKRTSKSGLFGTALWLLALRAALRPFTYDLHLDPLWVLALSALTWTLPAVAMASALLEEVLANHRSALATVQKEVAGELMRGQNARLLEQLTATPELRLIIEPRTGKIVDGSESALSLLGLGRDSARSRDFWGFAPPGEGVKLRNAVLSLTGKSSPATLQLATTEGTGSFNATAREIEFDGRLLLNLGLAPVPAEVSSRLETSGALAAGFAHDLKNVLQTILSCSDGIVRKGHDEGGAALAIAESARKGDRLVRKILAGGKTDAGPQTEVELKSLLEGLVATYRHALPSSFILTTNLGDAPIPANALGEAIEQAVLNLLVNAREALGEGGRINLTLSVEGANALVCVEDSGPGVAPELREKIFAPLMTTKGRPGGLGLSMVRSTLARFGGKVECADGSALPGACFIITLPLAKASPGSGILIIDADDVARGELDRKLKLAGHLVYTTDDGDRGLAILKEKGSLIGTVVTDLVTRGLGGRNLLNAIKTQCPHARVLVHSSIGSEAAREGSLAAGATLFFAKAGEGAALITALTGG